MLNTKDKLNHLILTYATGAAKSLSGNVDTPKHVKTSYVADIAHKTVNTMIDRDELLMVSWVDLAAAGFVPCASTMMGNYIKLPEYIIPHLNGNFPLYKYDGASDVDSLVKVNLHELDGLGSIEIAQEYVMFIPSFSYVYGIGACKKTPDQQRYDEAVEKLSHEVLLSLCGILGEYMPQGLDFNWIAAYNGDPSKTRIQVECIYSSNRNNSRIKTIVVNGVGRKQYRLQVNPHSGLYHAFDQWVREEAISRLRDPYYELDHITGKLATTQAITKACPF